MVDWAPAMLDARLVDVFRPIRDDLLTLGYSVELAGPPTSTAVAPTGCVDPRWLTTLIVDHRELGILAFDLEAPFNAAVVTVADQAQAQVIENLRRDGQIISWPPSRGGNQPMQARLVDDQPMWLSPCSSQDMIRIGELSQTSS
ncbi:hypothetical protein [Nocardia terpenica]|uniref:Uncharacterized protein n=1 Tax=Nocardia terpenica TaxID=455432 RepID=A0A164HHU4_9NOCA|nr:hypothetical protein [Nocardia terpenica]KZM68526.1 hypothetical protein AWN90_11705 [Nocardia terpenica]NQE88517.1 hypothetical protein [Nocardia terpenica]